MGRRGEEVSSNPDTLADFAPWSHPSFAFPPALSQLLVPVTLALTTALLLQLLVGCCCCCCCCVGSQCCHAAAVRVQHAEDAQEGVGRLGPRRPHQHRVHLRLAVVLAVQNPEEVHLRVVEVCLYKQTLY